MKIALKLFA